MSVNATPPSGPEAERRRIQHQHEILNALPDTAFHDLARLATQLCQAPIAAIALSTERGPQFKALLGLNLSDELRKVSFFEQTVAQADIFIVEDAAADGRFAGEPLVCGESGVRFYSGLALRNADGAALGWFCVMDRVPRKLTGEQAEALRILARQIMTQVEMRQVYSEAIQYQQAEEELRESELRFRQLAENIHEVFWLTDWVTHRVIYVSPAYEQIWGRTARNLYDHPREWLDSIHPEDRTRVRDSFLKTAASGSFDEEFRIVRPDQSVRWVHDRGFPIRNDQGEVFRIAGIAEDITKNKAAEEALRQAEQKYHSIFENVTEGIFQTTPDGHYLAANPMLARIYGYASPEELMAAVQDITHQLYVTEGRRVEFARLMQENEAIADFESQIHRKDDSVIWISENARAVRDAGGHLLYYEGTVRDITARKRAEDALLDSEILYHSLVESLPQNIFRKDAQERFTFANKRFCDTLGKPLAEILGRTDFDFFPEELARKYQQDDRRVMEQRETFETVEEHQKPDGSKLHVQLIKTPLYDFSGNVIGVQGMFWDVTERKKIEQTLAHERDLLRALLDHVPDRIYFKDAQSRFLKCSKALAERLGLSDPELAVGKTDFDFHPLDKAREFHTDEQRIIESGRPLINKIEKQVDPQRAEIWASVTKVPVYNQAGVVTGIIGISRDITALKKIEEELEINRDAALELVRQKSQFLATMSHEIRTPMNGILGMIGLLLDTRLTVKQRDFAETIRGSAEALLTIINDILDFSKIEAGKLTFETLDFDLREAMESTVELLAERAQAKQLELISFVPPDAPTALRGDPGRFRQILTNLVGNAVKFTEHGEVIVRAVKESETDQQVWWKFLVSDTGIGVPEEAKEKIFQAFTQADGSTTRKYGGTGLGLAISKQLVEMLGGRIGLEDTPGRGSAFWFTLPFEKQPPKTGAENARLQFPGTRILVVDDNTLHREFLAEHLRSLQIETELAATAAETLEALRRRGQAGHPFNLVVMDMNLPEMEGLALARQIHADAVLGNPRLMLLTGLRAKLNAADLRETGVAAVLLKPVRLSRLMECLRAVLSGETVLALEPAGSTETTPASPPPPAKPMRILLAEDNVVNQKVALHQLRKLGHSADALANGRDVLAALHRTRYDIILMDCEMPELDGYEATRQIRAQEKESGTHAYIIAMTANALLGDRELCVAAGMDDYLMKPVQLAKLKAAMGRGIEHLQMQAAPERASAPPGAIDPAVLAGLRELQEPGKPDPLAELIDLFLRDTPAQVHKMNAAHAQGDAAQLKSAAHSLKGSANNMGARTLANLCATVEKQAKAGGLGETGRWLEEVGAEFARVQAELESVKAKLVAKN